MRKNELLVPASSLEVLKIAVIYGADAVYIGGEAFGLRAKAKNFTMEEMAEGIAFAHARGVKVYVTTNILAHNYDLDGAREYLTELQNMKPDRPDALIIADPAIFTIAGEVCPDIDRHISTQANNTNYGTFQFWEKLGATRVVTARELSLREIRQIREHISDDLEIETFVHGAMCISYSGRCLLSNYFTGRDANRGACTHPCRWKYSVVEEKRPGEYFPVYENERGTYIFNSKDLCMIEHIPELIESGISSLKIEGRAKSAYYCAVTTNAYRHAVNDYMKERENYTLKPWIKEELEKISHREYNTGFYLGKEPGQVTSNGGYIRHYDVVAVCESNEGNVSNITQRNKFFVGDTLDVLPPSGIPFTTVCKELKNKYGVAVESAPHAMEELIMTTDKEIPPSSVIRKKRS